MGTPTCRHHVPHGVEEAAEKAQPVPIKSSVPKSSVPVRCGDGPSQALPQNQEYQQLSFQNSYKKFFHPNQPRISSRIPGYLSLVASESSTMFRICSHVSLIWPYRSSGLQREDLDFLVPYPLNDLWQEFSRCEAHCYAYATQIDHHTRCWRRNSPCSPAELPPRW